MGIILSITGLFKTLLIIIGVFVLLKFIGQLMIAKRNLDEQKQMKVKQDKINKAKQYVEKNKGKTFINVQSRPGEDIDFEEIN